MRGVVAAVCVGFAASAVGAQQLGSLDGQPPARVKQYVAFTAEPLTIAAGRRTVLELRFQVLPEFHINSHKPKSELLIPTVVELPATAGIKVWPADYPAGTEFSFAFDPSEKLDVYEGNFVVRVPVTATAGAHELKGMLHYQACNHAACYPPKDLPVDVVFTAR